MDNHFQERKLTAILAADVVGYSALMSRNEAATLDALKALRRDVIDPRIERHRGRTIKVMGDGSLVEFASAMDAVRCAVEIQHALTEAQPKSDDENRIEFRIGINVGDIIVEDDDIYGDGVNIASRIEGLADPGGICISRTVHDHIGGKLDLDVSPMGPQEVKNIPAPIEVYRIELNKRSQRLVEQMPAAPAEQQQKMGRRRGRGRMMRPVLAATVLIAAGAIAFAMLWPGSSQPPVVAVLPFQDNSPEEHRGLLSDPLSDGILAHLARYPEVTVIARGSSFRFRDADRDLRDIGRQLEADYIVEGSLHFDGDKLAVNAALVDVKENVQIWSDLISADIDELMQVIADIGRRVAYQVEDFVGGVQVSEAGNFNSGALLMTMQARKATMRGLSRENNAAVIEMNRQTLEKYPDDAWGHLAMAFALRTKVRFGWADDAQAVLAEAIEHAETAVRLAPDNYSAYFALGRVRLQEGDHQRAIEAFETGLKLNPSSADTLIALAQAYLYLGDNDRALEILAEAGRIDPLPSFVHSWLLAWVLWQDGQCEDAERAFAKLSSPPAEAQKLASVIQVCLGNTEAARAALAIFLEKTPGWDLQREAEVQNDVWVFDPGRTRWLENLASAGMPNGA